jgi:nucleotide-binding universal stress UspA family protein
MYSNILIPIDGSDASRRALTYGIAFARNFGATVHTLYVLDQKALTVSEEYALSTETITAVVADDVASAFEDVQTAGSDAELPVTMERRTGDPVTEILQYASERACDLIILSPTRERRFSRFLRRSVTRQVIQTALLPVVTVPTSEPRDAPEWKTILLATDGRAGSRRATTEAIELAVELDAALHVVYVVEDRFLNSPIFRDVLEQEGERSTMAVSNRATQLGVPTVTEILRGNPADELRDYTAENGVNLVVMGTYGRTGLDRFMLGSVTRRMVRRAETPLLTVRAEESANE